MDTSRYAVGIDIGTDAVRVVVAHSDQANSVKPTIIGVATEKSLGVRKGVVSDIESVATCIDKALETAERMSGHRIERAAISINGSHIVGIRSKGTVAVSRPVHEITADDISRAEEAATVVQLPPNREILEVTPQSYRLDDQENIKDPIGMTGIRLEVDAHVITGLSQHLNNLNRSLEMTETHVSALVPSVIAAARSVLDDQSLENGVAVIDIGATTTGVAVFDEHDLYHMAVLPVGSNSITKDLAIGLQVDLPIADKIKTQFDMRHTDNNLSLDSLGQDGDAAMQSFDSAIVREIVEARVEDILERVLAEINKAGGRSRLPAGVVLTGGGALLSGIDQYAKKVIQLSCKIGKPESFGGMTDEIESPIFACAYGLMIIDSEYDSSHIAVRDNSNKSSQKKIGATKKIFDLLGRFKI